MNSRIKFSLLFGVISLLLVESYPCMAFYREPSSIADSKQAKTFQGIAIPEPDHFRWDGHDVVVHEAWLDKYYNGKTYLLFKLKIDGKFQREHPIETKEGTFLDFERADGLKPILFFYNLSRGLFGQQRIYFLELPTQKPEEIKLDVNTSITVDRKPVKRSTGITITFRIPASGAEGTGTEGTPANKND